MKANLVSDEEDLKNPGDIFPVFNKDKQLWQLFIVCPKCGKKSGSAGRHKYDSSTMSYTPSIIHDVKLGGCGWHRFLTNGNFTNV